MTLARLLVSACALSLFAAACTGDVDDEGDVVLDDDLAEWEPEEPEEVDVAAPDDAPVAIVAPAQFRHPGILVNRAQLDFVRGKVQAKAQPWKTAFDRMKASKYGKLDWRAKPRKVVNCGPSSNPNEGCSDEREDAVAAYTHALLWYMTRDRAHANKAIAILDAWARTIEKHTGHNAPLQTGWAGSMFPAAAEIIRHTYDGWDSAGVQRVATMLRTVHLPTVRGGRETTNGNWELIMTEATMAIAVFLEDRTAFDQAVALWRRRVPAYIYLTKDGDIPRAAGRQHNTRAKIIKYWYNQTRFVDGLSQETCRDFGHTQWGIAAALATAETAYQQGVNLYDEQDDRLRAGMEFHAEYVNGKAAPSWLCGGDIQRSNTPSWEIGYNHLRDRLGRTLPHSERFIREKVRTNSTPVSHFIAWETLTHAGVGRAGL